MLLGLLATSALVGLGRRVVRADEAAGAPRAPVDPAAGAARGRRSSFHGVPGAAPAIPRAIASSHTISRIEGMVRDSLGQPVPGARVCLVSLVAGADRGDTGSSEGAQTGRADDEGRFVLSAVPGDFALYASDGDRASPLVEPLSLAPGESLTGMELSLTGGGVVAGIVINADGTPASATISVRLQGSPLVLTPEVSEKSSFALSALPDAPLELFITDGSGRVQQRLLARPARDLVIRLAPPPGTLIVEVRDEAGAPAANALITVQGEQGGALSYTGEDGRGRFDRVSAHVQVDAQLEGEHSEVVELDLDEREQTLRLTLRPSAQARGQILEADGRAAQGSVLLRSSGHGAPLSRVELDEEGRFTLDHLPLGRLDLFHVEPGESEPASERPLRTLLVSDAGLQALGVMRLDAVRRVRGLVLDGEGAPAAHVDVETLAPDERSIQGASTITDERGRFELTARGPVHLRAVGLDGELSPIARLAASGDEETTLTIAGVGNLDGMLRGRYPADARVRCVGGLWHEVEPSGQFHLQCPPGAELEVQAGGETRLLPVELEEEEATFVEVRW